ncbi:hypothetical protein AZF06_17420 [Priestia endophytica]|uniref:Phage integrase family protein n=1 Tax=Priestia endophytica DSM 13796 TaxID=1121089 RepID=A0A1I5YQX7_9BACI|nr:hypothetical protein AZF06_17420 [Priestia endophytica]SFQ46643.1 Phage integrase family protein [Priestia endophytica DSM 13796]
MRLREKDIDFQYKKISVIKNVANIKGHVYLSDVKTDSSRRRISIDDQLLSILSHQMKYNKKMQLQYGSAYKNEEGIIFAHPNGSLYAPSGLNYYFNLYIKEIGLPKITLHGLRHTHATLLLKMGANTKIVSERLGHSTIHMTLDTYSHVLDDMQEEVVQIFSKNLKIL